VPKTFEEAKPELLVSMRNTRAYGVAAKLAERAQARLKETKDPQAVAKELAAEANMSTSEMVKETGYIKPGDDVPDIGSNQQFEQAIAGLNNPNDVGERTGVKGGFATPMFLERKVRGSRGLERAKPRASNLSSRNAPNHNSNRKLASLPERSTILAR